MHKSDYTKSVLTPPSAFQARTYADEPSRGASTRGEPGPSTNVRSTPSANPESSEINANRGAEHSGASESPDTASTQKPVSNPEQMGMHVGAQEEPQPSQDKMKNGPSEPAHVKRSKVEQEGQKPLDPADK